MPPIFTEKLVNKIAYYKVGWEMLWNPENNVGSLAFLNQGQCRIQKPFQYFSHVLKLLSNAAEKPSSERQLPSHDRNAISRLSPCCASFRGAQPRYQSRPLQTLIYLCPHAQTLPIRSPLCYQLHLAFSPQAASDGLTCMWGRNSCLSASWPDSMHCKDNVTSQIILLTACNPGIVKAWCMACIQHLAERPSTAPTCLPSAIILKEKSSH